MKNIESALASLFQKQRIVFWYDDGEELRAEFEALVLPDVQKIELKKQRFLASNITSYEKIKNQNSWSITPAPNQNTRKTGCWMFSWLSAVFSADRASLWLAELSLPLFQELVASTKLFSNPTPA